MTTANTVGAASRKLDEWNSITGLKLSGNVRRLQVRIVKALQAASCEGRCERLEPDAGTTRTSGS